MTGFSVIVPSFNSSSYIERAFNSIATAAKERPFEVLVIDDSSLDIKDLEKLCSHYDYVRIIKKKTKTNAAHSRNIGIKHSRYPIVFLLDSDDILLEDAVDQRLDLHEKRNSGIIFGNYITKSGKRCIVSNIHWNGEPIRELLFCNGGDFRTSSISIYKRFYKNTMFDEKADKHQDWIFGIRCGDAGESITFDATPTSIIIIESNDRMSSNFDLDASKYLVREYLDEQAHVNGFSKKHWKNAIAMKNCPAIDYYTSIFLPQRNSEFLSKYIYLFLGKRYTIFISSMIMRLAKRVKWLKF